MATTFTAGMLWAIADEVSHYRRPFICNTARRLFDSSAELAMGLWLYRQGWLTGRPERFGVLDFTKDPTEFPVDTTAVRFMLCDLLAHAVADGCLTVGDEE